VGALTIAARRYELVVVGGGIMGLCVAAEAKRRAPGIAVAVVDRGRVGSGASAHSPGIQIAIGRTPAERRLAARGLREWRGMFSEGGWAFGRRCDLFWIAADPASLRDMHVGDGLSDAPPRALKSRLASLSPLLVPDGHAVLADRCSYSPVELIAEALRSRLAGSGCVFLEGLEAEGLRPSGAEAAVHNHDGSIVTGESVVVSIGPWAPGSALIADAGLAALRVKKVVSLHLALQPTPDCPAIAFQEDYAFLVPMPEEGHWLFSFTSDHWDVDPIPGTLQVEQSDVDKAMGILRKWFPDGVPEVGSARVFCDCYSADGVPFAALFRGSRRVAFVGAGSGNGFRFAPPCAQDALDLLGVRSLKAARAG
jgi:glycine/D-amino acid oxidase-like deaminating enzyme